MGRAKITLPKIVINNQTIQPITYTKFLGITVDHHLSWQMQVHTIKTKLNKAYYVISVLRNICNIHTIKTVYFAYVQSILSYGIVVWGSSKELNSIFIIQKKIIRTILNLNRQTHCKPYFKQLNILTVPCLYILESVCYIHRNIHHFTINNEIHQYSTRNRENIHVDSLRTSKKHSTVLHKGILMYNLITSRLYSNKLNHSTFKNKVKQFLLYNSFYSTDEFIAHFNK